MPQHASYGRESRHMPNSITETLDPITVEDLERGLKMLNTNTAVGIDQWSPGQLRLLSPEAKQILLGILQDVENSKAWPGYTYYNIFVLMGKPNGGVRPIFLMGMIYRLWTKARRE